MNDVISWWSGGVTSAVACKIAIDLYGLDNCRIIFIDTKNEHEDTYRFLKDCEKFYNKEIEIITDIGIGYESIQEVWHRHLSLNVANGAICSSKLKRAVRERWQKENEYSHQVFGFEFDSKEFKRALSMKLNHEKAKPIFPLLMFGMNKKDCINYLKENGIEIPLMYRLGFNNNNCFGTGCVQGGIGYWQKIKREFPEKFESMAKIEHELSDLKGKPVTMLKDQSKNGGLVFLKKHKDYPQLKSIDQMEGREPESLVECNGFCGIDDLIKKDQSQLNFEEIQ